ncbi:MAG: LptF/LptG family permease [Bacteroidetes bacterium]|nr:LptF/LptG family permease [Bacteroidota bacterium]
MIIYRYILKNHFFPFVFSVFTLIAVFLLQFLMKFADKLVGKGLSLWVIFKLISFNLAWMVVLVVPMAVLVATLMAFGGMTQNNEIAILKSSGVSLYKIMIAPLLGGIMVALLLIHFNNSVYPDANHAARILLQDISKKKPTLSLVPGVFSQEVSRYSILVRDLNPNSNELKNVTIYDNSEPLKLNIVTAESGKIYFSKDQKKLIMDLTNGEIHESDINNKHIYRKLLFEKHKIAMDAEQFSFQQSSFGGVRGDRELSAQDMLVIVDSLKLIKERYDEELSTKFALYFGADTLAPPFQSEEIRKTNKYILLRAGERLNTAQSAINTTINRVQTNAKSINRYWVEIHKKYSIPVACIIFVLIGAPLGTMTRKGGFGVAAGVSLIFFLVYWAFLIGGEKLADRGLLSPFWGMWSANILLGILGIYFLIKSAKERVTIDFSYLQKFLPKKMRIGSAEDENT